MSVQFNEKVVKVGESAYFVVSDFTSTVVEFDPSLANQTIISEPEHVFEEDDSREEEDVATDEDVLA